MTREEAIQAMKEAFKNAPNKLEYEKNIQDRLQLLVWLDYERLKSDYIELDKQLRTANTENDELKRMLRLAVRDIGKMKSCEIFPFCIGCPKANEPYCEWKHRDEAMKLLGGNENDYD